jgi:hypothetical protein
LRIEQFNLDSIRRFTELLLDRRDELDHPDPAAGVRFCSIAIATMSRFLSLFDGEAATLLDLSDENVEREMHRFFTRHLASPNTRTVSAWRDSTRSACAGTSWKRLWRPARSARKRRAVPSPN